MNHERFYVYEHIRNDTNAVFYVGKGSAKRAKHGLNRGVYWDRVVNKAGGFAINYPVKNVDEELSLLAEMELIDKYRRLGVKLVNVSAGGEGTTGWIPTEETRRKIGLANKTTPKATGKSHGMYGKKHTEESLAKMRASQKAREWGEKHPFYGKHHSEETKKKIILKKPSKPVFCLTNGISYYGLREASRQLNVRHDAIRKVCDGKQKQTGGYKFQWITK